MNSINLKIGDSLSWKIDYKQSDNITGVNLIGFEVIVKAINKFNSQDFLFNISSNDIDSNKYIEFINRSSGIFSIIIKDTSQFKKGEYFVDIEYIDSEGFKTSSKSITLKVQERV